MIQVIGTRSPLYCAEQTQRNLLMAVIDTSLLGEHVGLSKEDVSKLMADPSPDVRAETTGKIAAQYDCKPPTMTDAER